MEVFSKLHLTSIMYRLLILFTLLTNLRCTTKEHKSQDFDEIQISFSDGWHTTLSLKIIDKSRIIVRNNISGQQTQGELNSFNKATLDSFILRIDILSLDSVYKPVGFSIYDCGSFRIYVREATLHKTVYSDCLAPEPLKAFLTWLIELSKTFVTTLDSTVNYSHTDEGYRQKDE